jgi:hypothetical protein
LEPAGLAPPPVNLRVALENEAKELLRSGYFERFRGPKKRKQGNEWITEYSVTEEQAIVNMTTVMVFGRELNLSPMQSLQHVYPVNGIPGLDFQILQAMVRRNGRGFIAMWPLESSTTEAVYHIERHDGPVIQQYDAKFTAEDAKRLGLGWKKNYDSGQMTVVTDSPWQKQPDVMLLRRAGCKAMRELAGDLIQGFFSLDEVGIQVQLGGDREVPVLTPQGEPVIERLVLTPEAEDDIQEAEWEADPVRDDNNDGPATPELLSSWKLLVKTYCEGCGADLKEANVWLNNRIARMGLSSSADATGLQLDTLYDALTREYGGGE